MNGVTQPFYQNAKLNNNYSVKVLGGIHPVPAVDLVHAVDPVPAQRDPEVGLDPDPVGDLIPDRHILHGLPALHPETVQSSK